MIRGLAESESDEYTHIYIYVCTFSEIFAHVENLDGAGLNMRNETGQYRRLAPIDFLTLNDRRKVSSYGV